MTKYVYENTLGLLNQFGKILAPVEIEADSQEQADEIYRGMSGERAEDKMRDEHV